jgi:hypothetical protein
MPYTVGKTFQQKEQHNVVCHGINMQITVPMYLNAPFTVSMYLNAPFTVSMYLIVVVWSASSQPPVQASAAVSHT